MAELQKTPPEAPRVANKRMVIDALVLACSQSDLKELVGTDALRMVLDGRYIEMVKTAGKVDLRPVWQILEAQPGFAPDAAAPPLCRFKSWEGNLGITIELPQVLAAL